MGRDIGRKDRKWRNNDADHPVGGHKRKKGNMSQDESLQKDQRGRGIRYRNNRESRSTTKTA